MSTSVTVDKLPRGLDAVWHGVIGSARRLLPRRRGFLYYARIVDHLNRRFDHLTDARLKQRLHRLEIPFRLGRDVIADRLFAAAAIREVIARTTNMRMFPVQIAGALALYEGLLVEMATGEGKSITAVIPAVLHGWRRRGCHIITVNDYLARRDSEEFKKIYAITGLSAGCVEQEMRENQRRDAYGMDITYATNKEVCADYLRDRLQKPGSSDMRSIPNAPVQRRLFAAIVDEADSVLIDEAVTPLIISGDAGNAEQTCAYGEAVDVSRDLALGRDYRLQPRFRTVELTAHGRERVANARHGRSGLWHSQRRGEELICQSLTARHFYLRDRQYVIHDDKVVIVDESTGRLMPDRHWRDGLHQAVEARESLEIQPMKETLARISFQRFFRLYERLCGMSGTFAEARGELWHVYRRDMVRLPTNRPCIRRHEGVRIFAAPAAKWDAIIDTIRQVHLAGRPVLIGTRSVKASEELSARLTEQGFSHRVLNARRYDEEAQIIAGAGKSGTITVATNMAGRGTDICLDQQTRDAGGLCVIATELHESERIDRQLAGRAGRQGDPGTNVIFACLEDELFSTHSPAVARLFKRMIPPARTISSPMAHVVIRLAQSRSQRLAAVNRGSVARMDEQLDESLGFADSGR